MFPLNSTMPPRRFFIPVEEALTVHMQYGFEKATDIFTARTVFGEQRSEQHGSSADTMTVLLDASGKPRRNARPSPIGVSLPMIEILDLAERRNWLDEPHSSLGNNYLKDAAIPAGPIGRLSGLEIGLHLVCYNSLGRPYGVADGWKGSVCTIQAIPSEGTWVSRAAHYAMGDHALLYSFHGVRLRIVAQRSNLHVNLGDIFQWLANIWVFLHLPRGILAVIVVWCLGGLSSVYKQALIKDLVLPEYM